MPSSTPQIYRTVFPLLARTATPTVAAFSDRDHTRTGGHFIIDVTAIGAAPSITPTIQAFDPLSSKWYNLLVGSAINTVSTNVLRIYPGAPVVANASASDVIPPTWRFSMAHGNADSITYCVSSWMFG